MSEFSKRCRYFIDKCGTNVYQISRRTGLDRTTMQKMVQGNRLPSLQFVEHFCDYLAINISDREELIRLFKIEKVGVDVWSRRQEVDNLLRDFSSMLKQIKESASNRMFSLGQMVENGSLCSRRLTTPTEVTDAIRYVIASSVQGHEGGWYGVPERLVLSTWIVFPVPLWLCRRCCGKNVTGLGDFHAVSS